MRQTALTTTAVQDVSDELMIHRDTPRLADPGSAANRQIVLSGAEAGRRTGGMSDRSLLTGHRTLQGEGVS